MLKPRAQSSLCAVLVLALLSLNFASIPLVFAAPLNLYKDTISNSAVSAVANHLVEFTTSIDIGANGYFEVNLPTDFGDLMYAKCSGPNVTIASTSDSVRCTYSVSPGAATSTKIWIYNAQNPNYSGRQIIDIATYDSGDSELERAGASVYITSAIGIDATVGSLLTFSLGDANDVNEVNGIKLTGSSTPSTIDFGLLGVNSSSTLAHKILMRTNADDGFSCTVEQDGEMLSAEGNNINSFDNSPDGTGSSTPHKWNAPAAEYNESYTYGHLGVTSDDFTLSSLDFSGSKFVGLSAATTTEIMYHTGKTDGRQDTEGVAYIAYSIEISALQEAGYYSNTVTYICTGNF